MKIVYDLGTREFSEYDFDNIQPKNENFLIGFRDDGNLPVYFGDFSLSIKTYDGEEEMFDELFPSIGTRVVYTDEEYSIDYTIYSLELGKEYRVKLVANHGGHTEIFDKNFYVSYTPPYPSWSWDETEKDWRAPEPRPEEGRFTWDEDSLQWVAFEE